MIRRVLLFVLAGLVCLCIVAPVTATAPNGNTPVNLLTNGSFEAGYYGPNDSPTGWSRDVYNYSSALIWDNSQAHYGTKSVKIEAVELNDARWIQTVAVTPNTAYRLTGWIKTENVTDSPELVNAGANLSLYGTWTFSKGVFGTHDWTFVTLEFNSEDMTAVTVAARLGYWAGTTTGTAWFDDLQLVEVKPNDPQILLRKLDNIQAEVERLVTTNALAPGRGNALVAKLRAARSAIERDNYRSAAQTLDAFKHQVAAFVKAEWIAADPGQNLTRLADDIIELLESNP